MLLLTCVNVLLLLLQDDGPARPGGLEELARKLNMGRKDVLEVLLDKFYEKG